MGESLNLPSILSSSLFVKVVLMAIGSFPNARLCYKKKTRKIIVSCEKLDKLCNGNTREEGLAVYIEVVIRLIFIPILSKIL
jgi:hypothetical protein